MLEGHASVHRNDNWMAVHRKCIHTWNLEIVFPTFAFSKRSFKLFLFHWRKHASITKMSGDAFLEWFTRCGEAPHGSVREFLGVRYFRPLESKSSVKTAIPLANVNGPWVENAWHCFYLRYTNHKEMVCAPHSGVSLYQFRPSRSRPTASIHAQLSCGLSAPTPSFDLVSSLRPLHQQNETALSFRWSPADFEDCITTLRCLD